MTTIVVRTVEKDNLASGGSECKFYRTYDLGTETLFQYGSQRNGQFGGQFKSGTGGVAESQIAKKQAEGYYNLIQERLDIPHSKLVQLQRTANTKVLGEFLDNLITASLSAPIPATPQGSVLNLSPAGSANAITPQVAPDQLNQLTLELLASISQASLDPSKAMAGFPALVERVDAVEAAVRKARSYLSTVELLIGEA